MLDTKEQDAKILPSEKWIFCASIRIQNLLSAHELLPLLHRTQKVMTDVAKKNIISKLQVVYMSRPEFTKNKSLKKKMERSTRSSLK